MKTFLFSTLFVCSSFMFACSDKESTTDEATDSTTEASSEPSSEASSEPSEPGSEPSSSEQDCGDLSQQDCYNCVAAEYPAGASAYNNYLIEHCVCANECQEDCTETCEDPNNVTQECNDCVGVVGQDQNSACVQDFGAACQTDSDCMTFAQGIQQCF